MSKIENTWRLAPVAAAQHELAEVRAALGFLPQGYTAMAGLDRLADLLAASEPSTTSPAVSTEHDEPITVTVDHDPRGVSVGVWQGSHCIYSGAHPLPAAAGVSTVENKPAAYLTLDADGSPCMLFFDVAEARTYCALSEEPEPLFRHAAPQASAENALTAPADVAQLVAFIFDRFGQPGDAGTLPDNVAAAVRRLERGIKAQADKDGGQQRAGDVDERAAFEAWAYRAGMGPKFRESMFAAWEARAALSATQAGQGERDA